MLGWLALMLALLLALFYFLTGDGSSVSHLSSTERWLFIGSAAIVGLYAIVLMVGGGGRLSENAKHLGIWAGLLFLLIAGYSYRAEFANLGNRVVSELTPAGQAMRVAGEQGEVTVRIRKHPSGHFVARGAINGTRTRMMIDTGASTVVLRTADAERAGIDVSNLAYTTPVNTANGVTYAAPVRLRSVAVGDIILHDIEALVSKPGKLNENLLGMSFLRRLRSYEFSGDFLTLRG